MGQSRTLLQVPVELFLETMSGAPKGDPIGEPEHIQEEAIASGVYIIADCPQVETLVYHASVHNATVGWLRSATVQSDDSGLTL